MGILRWGSRSRTGILLAEIKNLSQSVSVKPVESLSWDGAKVKDPLYAYDSVMTLENSETDISFLDGHNLHVLENSLIVIEPPKGPSAPLEISLKKGGYRLKLKPKVPVKIGEWTLSSDKSGEVEVRFAENKPIIRVLEGFAEVTLATPGSPPFEVGKGQIVERPLGSQTSTEAAPQKGPQKEPPRVKRAARKALPQEEKKPDVPVTHNIKKFLKIQVIQDK